MLDQSYLDEKTLLKHSDEYNKSLNLAEIRYYESNNSSAR